MALRPRPGARHGRAALGRAGFAGLAVGLYLAAGALATWPALRDADEAFLALAGPAFGGTAPGDHLQTGYNLWLVGHQLAGGEAPWLDPYSFQPEAERVVNLQGWLFGLPYAALDAGLGAVGAWNAFVLLSYVLAGGLACAWLRALGLPRGAALAGGLVFALAPYRVGQSTGHLLGPISALLPLTLWAVERRRVVLAGAALAAIPLSGQLHLALGAIPLVLAYALVRTRDRRIVLGAAAGALAAAAAGLLVRETVIEGSIVSGGRSLASVRFYSAEWSDLVARRVGANVEELVFLGWLTPLLALAGLVLLVRERRVALAALLALAALVPILLALGTHLPTYELLWEALPPLRFPRVPERLLPIACLALAALAAFALARVRARLAIAALLLVLALDLRVEVYGAAAAGEAPYSALAGREGRLLELPVFRPEIHFGSVYLQHVREAPRERPGGYSTTAPRSADRVARRLRPLGCGHWTPARERLLDELGVRYVAVHRGLYAATPFVGRVCVPAARRALERNGFRELARGGVVTLYGR